MEREVKLRFGVAKNGWLPVLLEIGKHVHTFDASYLPNDFLVDLTNALVDVLTRDGTYEAVLHEEPTENVWQFFRIQDEVVFTIVRYASHRRSGIRPDKLFEIYGSPTEVALPLWRGLKELASRRLKDNFKQNWSRAFPVSELDRLEERINDAKSKS